MNGLTPHIFDGISSAFAQLEANRDLWVGVLTFAGKHTTAGLDMPKFFGPTAQKNERADNHDEDRIDPFAINRRCKKPVVMAVQVWRRRTRRRAGRR